MQLKRKIRVLVIDDSLLFRELIATRLSMDANIEVAGTAASALEAGDLIEKLKPDVLTLDVEMPHMNGIEFLQQLMPQYPMPVVVVSSVSRNVFDALRAGAVDFVTKPESGQAGQLDAFINELIIKVKIASVAKVGQHKTPQLSGQSLHATRSHRVDLIAVGASTGGTEAVYQILKELPDDMPPIVVVQHMPPVFTKLYAERLNNNLSLSVKEATDGERLVPGQVLIAAGDHHLRVKQSGKQLIAVSRPGEKVSGHCPSVDVLFQSISLLKNIFSIGVILTGMGSDGAKGLLAMRRNGSFTIGQDEESCVVYGMPRVAFEMGAVCREASIAEIPNLLLDLCQN